MIDRAKMQPALLKAAEAVCIYHDTDGFCHPRNDQSCACWSKAEAVMQATGLSANAVSWLFQHTEKIEQLQNGDTNNGG